MVLKGVTTFAKSIVMKNEFTKRLALKFYNQYREHKAKKEFYSRIKNISIENIDTSSKPV